MADLIYRDVARFQACNWRMEHNEAIYDEIKEAIKRLLNLAPAVDAIPVEWLREFDLYYSGISGGSPYMNELLEAWHKEQEVRDT